MSGLFLFTENCRKYFVDYKQQKLYNSFENGNTLGGTKMVSILGQNIKKLRKEKGLSAYKLSKIAEIGTTTISEIENGKRQSLNSTTIGKIANALNITTDKLMSIEENKEYIVTDIEQTFKVILSSDELLLDDIELSNSEKLQIESALNATFAMIRSQRKLK